MGQMGAEDQRALTAMHLVLASSKKIQESSKDNNAHGTDDFWSEIELLELMNNDNCQWNSCGWVFVGDSSWLDAETQTQQHFLACL
ncbi:hypothetical protein J1N35_014584 [Gossypium stocksii]|uniref:Uncharacterized protein n=1 Tax=Gossypium stocksii TaxID=47602 RepID=A0A9D3VVN9_9ROSI|nr:hypothetical protein J1N35_014584 [Gossypium stocksii]